MKSWEELKQGIKLSDAEKELVKIEEELIDAMVKAREKNNLSQEQLAQLCGVKQSAIARMESDKHSPQIDSMLKILLPLGYTLKIVPKKS